jgi:hypothetical protein
VAGLSFREGLQVAAHLLRPRNFSYGGRRFPTGDKRAALAMQGWTQEKIRKLAEHHDNLSEDEQAAEIEAGLIEENQTVMVVPTELVPEIVKLINKKRPA